MCKHVCACMCVCGCVHVNQALVSQTWLNCSVLLNSSMASSFLFPYTSTQERKKPKTGTDTLWTQLPVMGTVCSDQDAVRCRSSMQEVCQWVILHRPSQLMYTHLIHLYNPAITTLCIPVNSNWCPCSKFTSVLLRKKANTPSPLLFLRQTEDWYRIPFIA